MNIYVIFRCGVYYALWRFWETHHDSPVSACPHLPKLKFYTPYNYCPLRLPLVLIARSGASLCAPCICHAVPGPYHLVGLQYAAILQGAGECPAI